MTHRSRLTAVLVDVPKAEHQRAVTFWSAALGKDGKTYDKFPEYVAFGEATPGVDFMVQSTGDDAPRVHLDIETDDVEAEVKRLEGLGATEIERHHSWVVMKDPAGTVFCVVTIQVRGMFEKHATPGPCSGPRPPPASAVPRSAAGANRRCWPGCRSSRPCRLLRRCRLRSAQ